MEVTAAETPVLNSWPGRLVSISQARRLPFSPADTSALPLG